MRLFSIHAPVKGVTHSARPETHSIQVSIHAPVKGATYPLILALFEFGVSIHAPVKGATTDSLRQTPLFRVSIHTPVKGATSRLRHFRQPRHSFNPRSAKEATKIPYLCRSGCGVSIRAPKKGATILNCTYSTILIVSIHTSTQEATRYTETIRHPNRGFNPRPREGSDR